MRVLVEGSGGSSGWPEPGCRCASCLRMGADARQQSTIVVDGRIRLAAKDAGAADAGAADAGAADAGAADAGAADAGAADAGAADAGAADAEGYRVRRLADAREDGPGGWEVTAPDGERLLYPGGPGAVPVPPDGAAPYHIAFLDLLGDPAQLGWLRARGLITPDTVTAVAFADHRVRSEGELRRRCAFWGACVPADGETVTAVRSARNSLKAGRRVTRRVLVIGGARSGKSERAELRLAAEPDVTYVATGVNTGDDPEWAARVAVHRARRPAWWRTAETADLAGILGTARGAVLIDGIGTWLAAVLDECGGWDGRDGTGKARDRAAGLVAAWRQTRARVVAVSDEAGLGVVPETPAGRLFRDELGRLNQALAAESEEAELVVAGRILPLEAW